MTQYVFRGDPKNELELTRKKEGKKYSLGRERSKEQNEYQKQRENGKKRKDGAGRGLALQQSARPRKRDTRQQVVYVCVSHVDELKDVELVFIMFHLTKKKKIISTCNQSHKLLRYFTPCFILSLKSGAYIIVRAGPYADSISGVRWPRGKWPPCRVMRL